MRVKYFLCVISMALLCGTQCYANEIKDVEDVEEVIAVTDVEIANYEKELNVNETMNLTVTVLPEDATDAKVTYKSSDEGIATVSSAGEIKGIAQGQVVIYVTAGEITKEATLVVKIPTVAIELNSNYQVMKPNETFQIKASVQPAGAASSITYKSTNEKVATVSAKGLIKAKTCGNTAIVITNGDMHVSISVIVNEAGTTSVAPESVEEFEEENNHIPEEVTVQKYAVLSREVLKYLYDNQQMLTIQGEGYTIRVDGKDIVNYDNELKTVLCFDKEEKGVAFVVNEGNKLCGEITIDLGEQVTDEKYLYLYNEQKKSYQRIATDNMEELTIDTAGKYLLTSQKLTKWDVNMVLVIIGIALIVVGVGVYIGVKKQYWFW